MSIIHEKRQYTVVEHDIAVMCPQCYAIEPLGNVRVRVDVDFDPAANAQHVEFSRTGILTYPMHSNHGADFIASQLVEVRCPHCGNKMIALDKSIVHIIAALNKCGAYTIASCDGNGNNEPTCMPYISFAGYITNELEAAINNYVYRQLPHGELVATPMPFNVQKGIDMTTFRVNRDWASLNTRRPDMDTDPVDVLFMRLADFFSSGGGAEFRKNNLKRWTTLFEMLTDRRKHAED